MTECSPAEVAEHQMRMTVRLVERHEDAHWIHMASLLDMARVIFFVSDFVRL